MDALPRGPYEEVKETFDEQQDAPRAMRDGKSITSASMCASNVHFIWEDRADDKEVARKTVL